MTIDRHSIFAQLSVGGVLDVKSADITMDETWAPFVQARIVCALPDPSVRELIDPRNDIRLTLRVRQDFGESGRLADLSAMWAGKTLGSPDDIPGSATLGAISAWRAAAWNSFGVRPTTSRSFNLSVRSRPYAHKDGTVSIVAASDEALLQDQALLGSAVIRPPASTVRGLVSYVLAQIGAVLLDGPADADLPATVGVATPGMTWWSFLTPILQQAGLRLWCDGRRSWRLAEQISTVKGNIVLSYLSTITDATDDIDRDGNEWYDAVQITYTWTDAWGMQQTAYDWAETPGYSKVLSLEYRDARYPGPGAAQRVLERALGRGRVLNLRAVSDYSVEPSAPITMTLPDTPVQTGAASAVTWRFPDGEMEVKSRGLVDTPKAAWVQLAPGEEWLDSPVGASWISEAV
ncbi:hypothetical protein [Leifsonia virtsii]|uniref:Minor tail protein n=1 Tax=Leifsonia virtsii TaxID=3035915 RepID=A0ABT8J196_9MICO|nr:hypothetical protein [Leifsonia virtsii]MDN4598842.1 hypothetical protein [Leifsonia virtsii]